MKVHFQSYMKRGIVICMSALTLFISVFNSSALTVCASSAREENLRMLDQILNSTGVSANYTMLSKVQQNFLNIMNGTASTYQEWCEGTGRDINDSASWTEYVNSDAFYCEDSGLSDFFRKFVSSTYFVLWLFSGGTFNIASNFTEEGFHNYLFDSTAIEYGKKYTVEDELVEAVRATYDATIEKEDLGYYYINTLSPQNVKPSWFKDQQSYENFKSYIKSSEKFTFINYECKYGYVSSEPSFDSDARWQIFENDKSIYLVCKDISNGSYIYFYGLDWNKYKLRYSNIKCGDDFTLRNINDFNALNSTSEINYLGNCAYGYYLGVSRPLSLIFSKDGRKMIVFKEDDALKNYLGGYREAYTNIYYDYSTSNDNSFTVSGDYFLNNGQYSHDIISNNISNTDNSGDTITEETINNIVGDTITNITNNYYGSGSGSGSGSNSGDNSGSGGGLSSLVGGIGDLLNFVVTLVGEVISLLANFFTQILNLLGTFKDSSGDFVGFLQDFFVFVPDDIWKVILLGITTVISIAVWKALKK